MCGLVGMAGLLDAKSRDILKDMLDVCQVRGRDSTGVVGVDRNMEYTFARRVGPPAYLFDSREYESEINTGILPAALIGHCRHKTSGKVDVASAHPFDITERGIIGVHNGTLHSYNNLDHYSYQKVDSQVLYEHLADNGPEETFNQISGAWACVWWDDNTKSLNFIRNDKRPLYFTWSKDLKQLYWASEVWMFGTVERKIDLWEGTESIDKFFSLPTNTLWSFKINPKATGKDNPVITMRPIKNIEPKTVATTSTSYSYNNKNKNNVGFDHKKAKGGEVTNPFQGTGVPKHLLPKPETNEAIPGGNTNTKQPAKNSSNSSKSGTTLTKPSFNSTNGSKPKDLETSSGSKLNQKTSRKKLSVVSTEGSKNFSKNLRRTGVDVRYIKAVDTVYIHDNKACKEYTEEAFSQNTDGVCSFCDEPIGGLEEVAEMFGPKKFVCQSCVSSPKLKIIQ